MTARYGVALTLSNGADVMAWDLDHTPATPTGPVQVTDGAGAVLDSLTFGWSMPDAALWPLQPNPMTAALALSIPDFIDEAWLTEGTEVSIQVRLFGVVKFRYFGRITDASATPRAGKRPGVVVSIAAVDTTVDPLETAPGVAYVLVQDGDAEDAITAMWDVTPGLGPMPPWPADKPHTVWLTDPSPHQVIDQVLLVVAEDDRTIPPTWQGYPGTVPARLILAPKVGAGSYRFAFDWVPNRPLAPQLTIGADHVGRGAWTWSRNKRTSPSQLTVNGTASDAFTPPSAVRENPAHDRPWGGVVREVLDTALYDGSDIDDLAEFYLPTSAEDLTFVARGWTPTVRWLLSHEDEATQVDIPADLFPRWDLGIGDFQRAACYARRLQVTGVPDHLNPYSDDTDPAIVGPIVGTQVTVAGGRVALDFVLRELQPATMPWG